MADPSRIDADLLEQAEALLEEEVGMQTFGGGRFGYRDRRDQWRFETWLRIQLKFQRFDVIADATLPENLQAQRRAKDILQLYQALAKLTRSDDKI